MKKRDTFLSYGKQSIDGDDIAAVVEKLRSPFLTQGPKVEEFEQAVAEYVCAKMPSRFQMGPRPCTELAMRRELVMGIEE